MEVVCLLLRILWIILIVQIIVSWVIVLARWRPQGVARQAVDLLDRITTPIYRPVRGLLPTVRAGSMGIDFSPIIVFIVIILLQRLIC
jgi:YggT family protein